MYKQNRTLQSHIIPSPVSKGKKWYIYERVYLCHPSKCSINSSLEWLTTVRQVKNCLFLVFHNSGFQLLLQIARMNTSPEKLCLNWKNFQQNISSAFRELRSDNDFSDVTLACEDAFQVSAHKVILASSSPFFMNILKMNRNPHPLIYMRGMKSEDLVAIVDFLYYGEAEIEEKNLDAFLAVAEELKVSGLTAQGSPANDKDLPSKKAKNNSKARYANDEIERARVRSEILAEIVESDIEILETENVPENLLETSTTGAVGENVVNSELSKGIKILADESDIGARVKSMMDFSENRVMSNKKPGTTLGRARVCKVCGKEGPMGTIMNHIEAKHIENIPSPCDLCGKVSKSRNGLAQHKVKEHTR